MSDPKSLIRLALEAEEMPVGGTILFDKDVLSALGAVVTLVGERAEAIEVLWLDGTRQIFHEVRNPPPSACLQACLGLHERLFPGYHWALCHPGYDEGVYQDGKARMVIYHPLSSGGNPKVTTFARTPALTWVAAILRMRAMNLKREQGR